MALFILISKYGKATVTLEKAKYGKATVTLEKACVNVLGAQKNHLIEMVLLSTHNICFDLVTIDSNHEHNN